MNEAAEVGGLDGRSSSGRLLVVMAILSVPLALFWSAGIVVAIIVAVVAVLRMPARPASRMLYWVSLLLALVGTALSLMIGIAEALIGT